MSLTFTHARAIRLLEKMGFTIEFLEDETVKVVLNLKDTLQ